MTVNDAMSSATLVSNLGLENVINENELYGTLRSIYLHYIAVAGISVF